MRPRPASVSLNIHPTSWCVPRPPTPRRATFPLPYTTSDLSNLVASCTPRVPVLSYWLPDTPSPFSSEHPSSPVNPFLIPPQAQSFYRMASPLIPASPLSMFDHTISPGYVVSPMGSMCAVGMSPLSPTFLFSPSATPTPTRQSFVMPLSSPTPTFLLPMAPLSPSFMFPRTPPCPREIEVKMRPRASAVEHVIGRKQSVQHALEDVMGRKASMVSVLSMGQERMRMKVNFYQWLAVRRWEGMEKKEMLEKKKRGGGWRIWARRLMGKTEGDEGKKKGITMLKDAVMCV